MIALIDVTQQSVKIILPRSKIRVFGIAGVTFMQWKCVSVQSSGLEAVSLMVTWQRDTETDR